MRSQMPPHGLARLCRITRFRPERVIDVETAGAQLAKARDAAGSIFRRQAPHAHAAETARIADCSRQRRGGDDPHRRQDDWIREIQPFGQGI